MNDPGKYDEACTQARLATDAKACVLMIADGKFGDGFSVQFTEIHYLISLPNILRFMAASIEQQIRDDLQSQSHQE